MFSNQRIELKNHISVIIKELQLDNAIVASDISADMLLSNLSDNYSELKFPADYQLKCLHRHH